MKQIDERDIIFSRMNYKQGTPQYDDYYSRNPDKKLIDDNLRSMPQMGNVGNTFYDAINSPIVDAAFKFLSDIKKYSEGEISQRKIDIDPKTATERLKGLARFYGAKLVGIAKMENYHYYSNRGREAVNYGEEITEHHKYGIVFAVEMEREMIYRAPQLSESIAVTKGYVDAAIIGMILSYYIRRLGYEARNHMDGNYLVIAPLVAESAGLGEFGRHGLLVTREYGPRVRLGVVTTDMPLLYDEKDYFGMHEFCELCVLCSRVCPGRCIPEGGQCETDGLMRWKIDSEACYSRWRMLGTDCGICLASCPFSSSVDSELISKMKESAAVRLEILEMHKIKHGIRPYIKGDVDWMI
ncbi:MAG: 4Fe-4S ferredoxin [Bacillota bacterium]